jgi:uncharacterized protein YjiS (DUF1127 family)
MSTPCTTWLERTSVSTRHVSSLVWKYWDAFQERGERQKLRATLSDLSDRELVDIGIARGEIDYIGSHRKEASMVRAIPGDGAFGGDASAEADASIELVPTPEGEAAAGTCGHPLVCRAGADAGQLDEFHVFVLEEIAAVCEEKDAEIGYLRAIVDGIAQGLAKKPPVCVSPPLSSLGTNVGWARGT